jgi:pimeloyl-ACP methyl ester carboxylesterase
VLFWVGLALLCSMSVAFGLFLILLYIYLRWKYLPFIVRIFQEKPLFVIPRGQPSPEAESVRFPTSEGLMLSGCYLRTARPRRGVILFGLEFGSDCWSCRAYCEHLVASGFDVFAFESRNQGSSDRLAGYEPLQWVTDYEVRDVQAALAYLKGRPDADPRGVGLFGISKGASAGLITASDDPYVRCFVTDGMFATFTTLVPYMRQWVRIYNQNYAAQELIPMWLYRNFGLAGMGQIERERRCRFPHLEKHLPRLAPRPLLMIHGQADTYIKPDMAGRLYESAQEPKEFWLVEGAKHNQALQVAGEEYRQRVLRFFEQHLAELTADGSPTAKHANQPDKPPDRDGTRRRRRRIDRYLSPLFRVFIFFGCL